MNRLVKVVWKTALSLGAVLFLLWLILQTSPVQTTLARMAVEKLEKKLGGSVSFSTIHFRPFNAFMIKDLTVIDSDPAIHLSGAPVDTILTSGKLYASLSFRKIRKEGLHIRRASIQDARFNLVREIEGTNVTRFIEDLIPKEGKGLKVKGDRLTVENLRLSYTDARKEYGNKPSGMLDPNHIELTINSFRGGKIILGDGSFKASVQSLQAVEKSGLSIMDLTAGISSADGRTEIIDFDLKDSFSHLNLASLTLDFTSDDQESRSIGDAELAASAGRSRIDARTLAFFLPSMQGKTLAANLEQAELSGNLNDLSIDRLTFSEETGGIRGSVEGSISGITGDSPLRMNILAEDFRFSSEGIGRLAGQFIPNPETDLSRYAQGRTLTFNGRGFGTLESLRVIGRLDSGEGSAEANLAIAGLETKGRPKTVTGTLTTDRLDIGNLTGVSKIGECTLRGGFNATAGPEGLSARIDSLTVDSFDALGYSYSNIRAAGTYSEKAFDGRLVCHDPNLNLLFQGLFTLSDKTSNGLYKFYANVGYADLHALHLDSRPVSKVSGQVDANYMTVSGKDLIGDLDVMDLVLEDEASRHEIGDIRIKSHSNDEIHRINIGSDFLTGSFVGTKPLTSLLGDITELTVSRDLPALLKKKASTWKNDEYDVTLNVHDAQDVLAFFKPGLYIADSTKAVLSVSKDGEAKVSLTSSRLAIGKNYLKGLNFTVDNSDGSLNGAASCEEASAALFRMAGSTFTFFADEDRFSMGCTYDNRTRDANKGELHLAGNVERSDKGDLLVHARTLPSSIWYNGSKWAIPSSGIEVCGKDVSIESLSASCRDQSIRIAGGLSPSRKDTLVMDLSKMDLSILGTNSRKDLGIAGLATGKVLLMSPLDGSMGLMANVTATGTEFGHSPIGTFLLGSSMDENGSIHVVARNDIDGRKTFDIRAGYTAEEKALEGKAVFNSLDAGYLRPLLYKFVSDISGTASGQLDISIKDGTLKMDSKDCSLDNAMMRIAYTDVPYWFTGPFSINEKGVSLSGITVRDRNNGVGKATGGLSWDNFKNARMDASITIDRMEAFNIAENTSQYFYGNQSVTGTIGLSGPTNSLLMDVDVRTDGDGQIHIPLDYNASARKNELLTFKEDVAAKEKEDPYLRMLDNFGMGPKKAKDLRMKIRVDAGRSTEAFVELDRSAGNILAGRGAGIIDMDIRPNRNIFTINGDYTISEGTFHFNAMDIAKRTFTISDGSTIRFNGDIMDSDLGISGRYSTKASLSALIADTSSVSTRRQVNCGIEVSGKLREPELAFSIDIPDIDPTTKSKVESALNTDDKIQKQMVALLLSGSFLPDEQSGIVNNSNTLYNNVAEIMAGQLNNILQKLDIPLDFGLNYQSSESGYNIFDVAISTQLFNNRVLVNGAFGNREYSSSRTGDDMAGDLDIEIKMDKTGQLRLNMFSHAADDYTNYLDNTQRSGAGVSFQKEFDSFKEFFRNLFRCKRKAGTQEFAEREEEKKTIIIE